MQDFWFEHDKHLNGVHLPREVMLSHDLYRGMPSWFNAYYAHFQTQAVKALLNEIGSIDDMCVLDVGCGTGRWTEFLAEQGGRIIGVDIGTLAVQLASIRGLENAGYSVMALPDLGFQSSSFDLIISVTVLQHLPYSEQYEALSVLYRILRPSGFLITLEIVEEDPAPHVFGNSREVWIEKFESEGFHLVRYRPCEYLPYVKIFHWLRAKISKHRYARSSLISGSDVSQVSGFLKKYTFIRLLVRGMILMSYPLEYLSMYLLSSRLARVGGFLLVKQ